jgi:hypothetical protein
MGINAGGIYPLAEAQKAPDSPTRINLRLEFVVIRGGYAWS